MNFNGPGWQSGRAAGLPRYMQLARSGGGGGGATDDPSPPAEGDTCNFEALGLTRESWGGLDAEAQRSLVVRFLVALGSETTPEQIAADVAALPDAAARLAYLEAKTGCTVPGGAAPGGGGGAGPVVGGAAASGGRPPVVSPSVLTGGAAVLPELAPEAEPTRWVLRPGEGVTRRGRGGALLLAALAAYALTRRPSARP